MEGSLCAEKKPGLPLLFYVVFGLLLRKFSSSQKYFRLFYVSKHLSHFFKNKFMYSLITLLFSLITPALLFF